MIRLHLHKTQMTATKSAHLQLDITLQLPGVGERLVASTDVDGGDFVRGRRSRWPTAQHEGPAVALADPAQPFHAHSLQRKHPLLWPCPHRPCEVVHIPATGICKLSEGTLTLTLFFVCARRCRQSCCGRVSVWDFWEQGAPLLAGIGDALAIVRPPGRVDIQGLLHILKLPLHPCTAFRRGMASSPSTAQNERINATDEGMGCSPSRGGSM